MPTPPHLTALLAALGDGGTVATCEAVCAAAGGTPGHVPAPHVDVVMAALGDTAARDTADRVVTVYTGALPAPAVEPAEAPEQPQEPAGDDNPAEAPEGDAPPVDEDSDPQNAPADDPDDDIDWDDNPEAADKAADIEAEQNLVTSIEASAPASAKDIRAWAKTTGIPVPTRGAIPSDIRAQYDAAHA